MSQPADATAAAAAAAAAERHVTPRPPSHNGSTSSSNDGTPRATSIEPGPTIWVEMWENQRWYPVIGWSTSRFQQDLPLFCRVPPGHRVCGAHPPDFDVSLNATNPPQRDAPNPHFPAQSVIALQVPRGYRWVGYWEICKQHPHGTDVSGWRYAEHFLKSDGDSGYRSDTLAPFKKTQTPLCVVRRRLWRRRVAVLAGDEVAPSSDDLYMTDEDMQTQTYLSDMDEEMAMAEEFKLQEAQAAKAGTPWTQEQEFKAEEELRKFCRQRRSRESATRMRSTNPSFANPFHEGTDGYHISPTHEPHRPHPPRHSDEHASGAGDAEEVRAKMEKQYSGAIAASSWAVDSKPEPSSQLEVSSHEAIEAPQEAFLLHAASNNTPSRVDGSDLGPGSRVNRFVASTPTDSVPTLRPDEGNMVAQNTVDEFVASTPTNEAGPPEAEEDDPGMVLVGGIKSPTGEEFRAIFSQFMTPSAEKKE